MPIWNVPAWTRTWPTPLASVRCAPPLAAGVCGGRALGSTDADEADEDDEDDGGDDVAADGDPDADESGTGVGPPLPAQAATTAMAAVRTSGTRGIAKPPCARAPDDAGGATAVP